MNSAVKNNLAIIYKNGLNNECPNLFFAKEYLSEAIKQDKNYLAFYNLANIIFDEEEKENKDHFESIDILAKFIFFFPSIILFCLILIKKYRFIDEAIIKSELKKHNPQIAELSSNFYQGWSTLKKLINDVTF